VSKKCGYNFWWGTVPRYHTKLEGEKNLVKGSKKTEIRRKRGLMRRASKCEGNRFPSGTN